MKHNLKPALRKSSAGFCFVRVSPTASGNPVAPFCVNLTLNLFPIGNSCAKR